MCYLWTLKNDFSTHMTLNMFKFIVVWGEGVRGVSHVSDDGTGWEALAMFKVIGRIEGRQPCSRWWEWWGVSIMFKVIGGGEGHQSCSRWWEEVRGVSHVQGDERGEGSQPCSRWWEGDERCQPCSRWYGEWGWQPCSRWGGEGRQSCSRW